MTAKKTQDTRPVSDTVETTRQHESETLDEGLDESFPASDPVAVSVTRVRTDADGKVARSGA
jgi:hypothetical protein